MPPAAGSWKMLYNIMILNDYLFYGAFVAQCCAVDAIAEKSSTKPVVIERLARASCDTVSCTAKHERERA